MQREMQSKGVKMLETVTFDLSLEELRRITGTEKKFDRLSQFKAKVIDQAIK